MDQFIDEFVIALLATIGSATISYIFQVVQNRAESQNYSANRTIFHLLIAVAIGCIPLALYRVNLIPGNRWVFPFIFVLCSFISYRILQTDKDVALPKAIDEFLFGWPGKIGSGLKGTTGRRRWLIAIMTIVVLVLGALGVSALWLLREPEPLAVLVQLGDADPDRINPNEALEVLEGHLDELGLETYGLELRDELRGGQENDLAIAVRMSQEDCEAGELVSYTWTWQVQPADSPLDELVRFYMAGYDFGQDGSIEVMYLCDGRDTTAEVLASFILFVNGLHRSLALQEDPSLSQEKVSRSFNKATELLNEVTHGDLSAATSDTSIVIGRRDEQVELARHLHSCVQTFNFVEVESLYQGSAPNLDSRSDALINLIAKLEAEEPSEARPPADVCLAQAYYWLGRNALNNYLEAPADTTPSQATAYLTDAEQQFNRAIHIYQATVAMSDYEAAPGYHWLYYFYLGLTQYRQGRLEQAKESFDAAENRYTEYSFNPFPKELLAYMKARIQLEGVAYGRRGAARGVCQEAIGPPLVPDETAVLQSLRNLNDQDGATQGALNLGIMSLFHEALYQYTPEAITVAERSLRKASNPRNDGSAENMALLEALLDNLYALPKASSEAPKAFLDNEGLQAFRRQAGAVAYVLPLWPRLLPDAACGGEAVITLTANEPLDFLWRLRNVYDEPVFFSHRDQPQSDDLIDPAKLGSDTCKSAYCLRIGENEHWPLVDRGYGLFEAAATLPFRASAAAVGVELREGQDQVILTGQQTVSLVRGDGSMIRPVGDFAFKTRGVPVIVPDRTKFVRGNTVEIAVAMRSDEVNLQKVALAEGFAIQADALFRAGTSFYQAAPLVELTPVSGDDGRTYFTGQLTLDDHDLFPDEYRIRIQVEDGDVRIFINRYEIAAPPPG